MRSLGSLPPHASARRRAWTSLTRWSCRENTEQATGSPTFLSNPCAPLLCSLTPDGLVVSGRCDTPARSPLTITAKTPIDYFFRGSITRLQCSLSTLRRMGRPTTTHDSLPAAGQALPDGVVYPLGCCERFQIMYSFTSPSSFLRLRGARWSKVLPPIFDHLCRSSVRKDVSH